MSDPQNSPELEYRDKGYSKAEVEILVQLAELKTKVETVIDNYVKREEFEPVQRLVYGLTGLILTAVAIAAIAFLLSGGGV